MTRAKGPGRMIAKTPSGRRNRRLEGRGQETLLLKDQLKLDVSFLIICRGPILHALDLNSMPVIKEGMLVTGEFCAQYRVLEKEIEMLQEENLRLRRMLEYFVNPRLLPLPPKE
jgi:hypothetical protein